MSHPYQLSLTLETTGETVSLSGEFSDEVWDRLNAFLEYSDDLLKTKYVRDGMPASFKMKMEKDTGIAVSAQLPDWDDVTVFLHKFRPIGLQSESTNFYNICSVLTKELAHPYFRSMVQEQVRIFSGKRAQSGLRIQANDVILNSERVLNDWLNSYEYHRDKEKRKFIESLHQVFPLTATKVLFLGILADKTEAIHNIATLTRVVVGKQSSAQAYAPAPPPQ